MKLSRLLWPSPGFATQVNFHLPMHMPEPTDPRIEERADARTGEIDVWKEAQFYELNWEQLMVPAVTTGSATGYYGANGVADFIS